jgi:hypothetical protein
MKTFGGTFTAVAVAALLTAVAVEPSAAAPNRAVRAFDGAWSVLINTAYGNCGSYRAAVQIADGRVVSNSQDYAASGYVTSTGVTAVTVASSVGNATGYGRLRGSVGGGQWRSASGECAGTWSAERRGY